MANKADDFQKLIDRIEKTNNTFHGILSRDPRQLVITPDFKSKIDSIIGRNERLLKKLMSKEFEIAVVGLEKAGKSTVSNALLGVNILPAKALGMKTVWIKQGFGALQKPLSKSEESDYTINNLAELLKIF